MKITGKTWHYGWHRVHVEAETVKEAIPKIVAEFATCGGLPKFVAKFSVSINTCEVATVDFKGLHLRRGAKAAFPLFFT